MQYVYWYEEFKADTSLIILTLAMIDFRKAEAIMYNDSVETKTNGTLCTSYYFLLAKKGVPVVLGVQDF